MITFEYDPINVKHIVELGFVYNSKTDCYEVLYLDEFTEPIKLELRLFPGEYKRDSLTMYCHCYWKRRFQNEETTVKFLGELVEALVDWEYKPVTTFVRALKINSLLED